MAIASEAKQSNAFIRAASAIPAFLDFSHSAKPAPSTRALSHHSIFVDENDGAMERWNDGAME